MRVVFFGTPDFAVPTLDALLTAPGVDVVGVVTQPDRPRTRSHSTLLPSPVKQRALEAGVPVLQPERPRGAEFEAALSALRPDIGVVVAYGHILRPEILSIPRHGMVNVHASILPRWRGAAPIHWAILSGDEETGVSIMRMEQGLDSGPVWHVVRCPIQEDDTTGALFKSLAEMGARALVETLPRVVAGDVPTPQDESQVTLAPKIDRNTARIDWNAPAREIAQRIRAMDPAPGAWTTFRGTPVKLFNPCVYHGDKEPPRPPGSFLPGSPLLTVACADTSLTVTDVHPAGSVRHRSDDWMSRNHVEPSDRFE